MPKIIIKEYDKTKTSSTAYNNFTVLVPGFCGSSCNASEFDPNGVYACESQADFEKNIGKAAAKPIALVTAAKAPELDSSITVSDSNFKDLHDSGVLYYVKAKAVADNTEGYLEDKQNKYEPVPAEDNTFKTEFEEGISGYAVIQKGNEGVNKVTVSQMGNQIAYELLGLGYTVLFKKIDTQSAQSIDELASNEF